MKSTHPDEQEASFAARAALALAPLRELAPDWDSYGGYQMTPAALAEARALLVKLARAGHPDPAIVPTSPGGVGLEWHAKGLDLSIDIDPDESPMASVYFADEATNEEWEMPLAEAQPRLDDALGRIALALARWRFTTGLRAAMGEHEARCEHCRSFARQVLDGDFGPLLMASRSCPGCEPGEPLAVNDGPTERCAACGFPLLEGHRLEILWSEVPGRGIHVGWGGSDVWICACGWAEGEEEPAAIDHARAAGAPIALVPELFEQANDRFAGIELAQLPARPFRTFHRTRSSS